MADAKQIPDFWDQRYQTEEYVYGRKPNVFFSVQLETLTPGKLLLPGEGEGRNAVHASTKGWTVDAFDQSRAGQAKALALASELRVKINYRVCRLDEFVFQEMQYDAVALLFFHADPVTRKYLHLKVFETLKPGGALILEAFHKEQINKNTGGPKSLDMLFEERDLISDFSRFDPVLLEKKEVDLNEGPFHQGLASVIRFSAIKPR